MKTLSKWLLNLCLLAVFSTLLASKAHAQIDYSYFYIGSPPPTIGSSCAGLPSNFAGYVTSTGTILVCKGTPKVWTQGSVAGGNNLLTNNSAVCDDGAGGVKDCTTINVVTLTAPTINNPVLTGPAPVACGATCSPTAGQLILLNQAAGSTVTLPTSSGSGNVISMRITVALTSAAEKVLLTTTADVIIGSAVLENGGTAKVFVGNAGTFHSLQMPFAGTIPSGGFIGDKVVCTDIATGTWACDVQSQSGNATPVTPYSTATT